MSMTADSLAATTALPLSQAHPPSLTHRLRVRVDAREFSLPLSALAGVADCPALVRVPAAPPWLIGVGGLHGRLLPVVDLVAVESGRSATATPGPRILLVDVGGHVIGFSVNDVVVESDEIAAEDDSDLAIHALAARLLRETFTPPVSPATGA